MATPILTRLGIMKQKLLSGQPITMEDFVVPEQGPSAFGAGEDADRYQQAALRGGAPFTAKGLAQAFGNATGVATGYGALNPIGAGMRAGVAALTGEPVANAAFGVQDIEGQYGIDPRARARITDVHSYLAALHTAEKEAEAKKAAALQKSLENAAKQASDRARAAHGGGRGGGGGGKIGSGTGRTGGGQGERAGF